MSAAHGRSLRVRVPRRHRFDHQILANRFRPGDGARGNRVRHQRHRGGAAVDMTAPALIAQDWKDIVVVGVFGRNGFVGLDATDADERQSGDDAESNDAMALPAHLMFSIYGATEYNVLNSVIAPAISEYATAILSRLPRSP